MAEWEAEAVESDWAAEATVDRDAGLVRNVALCGNRSNNGYEIPGSAFQGEAGVRKLYQNRQIFANHLPVAQRKQPLNRPIDDLMGIVVETHFRNGRPYADIKFAGCPKGDMFADLADAQVPGIGLSHLARYEFESDNRRRVKLVAEVATVDCVTNPATTKCFAEQTDTGDKNMAEENKLIEKLEADVTRLTNLNAEQTKQINDLNRESADAKSALEKFESEQTELKTERDELKAKVDEFEVEQAMQDREVSIQAALEKAGLDSGDEKICTNLFLEQVRTCEDEGKRGEIIAERAELIQSFGEKKKMGGHSQARRKQGSSDTPEYSVETDLSDSKMFV